MVYRFEKYQSGDEKGIVNLFNLAFSEYGISLQRTIEEWKWRYLQYPGFSPQDSIFLAKANEEIIGTVILTFRNFLYQGKNYLAGMIDDVATHPDWREKDIAKELMRQATDYAEEKGADLIGAYTGINAISKIIFKKLDYFEACRGKMWMKPINITKIITLWRDVLNLREKNEVSARDIIKKEKKDKYKISAEYQFENYEDKDKKEILACINKNLSSQIGFTERTENYFNWRRINKPGFSPDDIILIKKDDRLNLAILSYHDYKFTRSGKAISNCSMDEVAVDIDFPYAERVSIGLSLFKEGLKRAKKKGALAFLFNIPQKDKFSRDLAQNLWFFKVSEFSVVIKEINPLGIDWKNGLIYLAKESCVGET